ncbi:MAG: TolC family protein [Deferribacteres bacterium]|nr:TolC family protein [candidate division KSB1 bacterium]MCB9502897.1 TolC family protein [Deferribacteres bacterium]
MSPIWGKRRTWIQLLLIMLFIVFIYKPSSAQTPRLMTLEDCISIAMSNSIRVKQLRQSLVQSQKNLQSARASYKSNSELVFSSLPNYQRTEQKIPQLTGGYLFSQQDNITFQGDLYVNQPIPLLDGTFSLVGSMERFDQNLSNAFSSADEGTSYSPNLTLQYQQPLFTYNRLKTGVRRAELNLEESASSYSRSQLELVYNITIGFFNLFKAQRQVEIDYSQVEQSQNAYNIGRKKQQAGLLAEIDVLRLEIDLANAQNTLSSSEALLEQNQDNFKNLIGLAINDSLKVTAGLDYQPVDLSVEAAVEKSLQYRTELRSDEISIELGELSVVETEAQREIKGQLYARYGLLNRANEISNAFRDFNDDRSIVVSLEVPLWDWKRNAYSVQAQEASLQSRKLAQTDRFNTIQIEVRTAVRNLKSADKRVQITKRSEDLAQKNYHISLLKFENGDLSSQELALEQNRLTTARTNYLNAVIDYKQALADLRRKTLWDFEKNQRVQVEVPSDF